MFRGGRVVDLAAGHGLLAYICLILDDSSAEALVVDRRLPKSASKLAAALVEEWPRLTGRIVSREADVQDVVLSPGDLVVSVHACGGLTDVVLGRALAASARVAVLPCCHDARENDTGGLAGWLSADMAIDVTRASRLRAAGYRVRTQRIVEGITEKSRLLMGEPGQRR